MGADRARIGIIGAGAIGCVVGGLLKRAGHDVTLVDPWPEHVEQIKSAGLRLSGSCGEHVVPITALHLHAHPAQGGELEEVLRQILDLEERHTVGGLSASSAPPASPRFRRAPWA